MLLSLSIFAYQGESAAQQQCIAKMTLKELTNASEAHIKKIDKELKAQEDEKMASELIDKGNALCSEGNYTEAKKSYQEARKLSKDLMVKREANDRTRKAAREELRSKKLLKTCNTKN